MSNNGKSLQRGIFSLVFLLFLGLGANPAAAQFGPVLPGVGPVNRAFGGVAAAAPISVAGALLWNPATLSAFHQSEIEVAAELLFPHTSLSSTIPAGALGGGLPTSTLSGRTSNQDSVFALPTIALMYRPEGSRITYGFGALAVAGFGLDYAGSTTNPLLTPPPPIGLGFGPVLSQYQVLQLAPTIVYDVTDQWSVSFSPLLNIGSVMLDPGVIAAPDDANGDGFATYPSATHSRPAWGAGFSFGTYYRMDDWAFGASFKSPQWFQNYTFNTADELGVPRRFGFNIDLPSIVTVGASYSGFDRWLLALDLRYLDFRNTDGFGTSGFTPDGALKGIGLKSVLAVATGVQYQLTDAMTVRAGYTWGENPIKSEFASANAASPLIIQNTISVGATYQLTDTFSLSMAYSHAFENSVTGPITLPTGIVPGTTVRSTTRIDMAVIGATIKF